MLGVGAGGSSMTVLCLTEGRDCVLPQCPDPCRLRIPHSQPVTLMPDWEAGQHPFNKNGESFFFFLVGSLAEKLSGIH